MKRFREIDALRGVAIVLMIVFHVFYDLDFMNVYSINLRSGFWWFFPRMIAVLFITIMGVSLSFSHDDGKKEPRAYLMRGFRLFSLGVMITLVTLLFAGAGYIRFGILHMIGVSTMIAYPFLEYKKTNLVLAVFIIAIGLLLRDFYFDFSYLLWLGLKPHGLYTLDYFPLLPWFGAVLIGIASGNFLYPGHRRVFVPPPIDSSLMQKMLVPLCYLGKHSLLIYLVHQPIIILFILSKKII